jgi:hypothetical protein
MASPQPLRLPATLASLNNENKTKSKQVVSVTAGTPLRTLLKALAAFRSPAAPEGYTLPAFSWFIDQTVGGAVATGTHGSSLRHGSLSNQARALCAALRAARGALRLRTQRPRSLLPACPRPMFALVNTL